MTEPVDVVWVSYHAETIPRGYWDQAMIEGILGREVWRPVGAVSFTHRLGFQELPAGAGAVVVVPGQHHVHDVARLNADLAALPWVLLLLTGDEESRFPLDDLRHPRMLRWIMTPRPGLRYLPEDRFIGEGWAPPTPAILATIDPDEAMARPLEWFFAGQITHQRRRTLAARLRLIPDGRLVETPGFTQGLPHEEYLPGLVSAKLAPAPAGPGTPDSFRLYEALEAGCLPLADGACPQNEEEGYWTLLFGERPPFPVIERWETIGDDLAAGLRDWRPRANRAFAWWQARKRRYAYDLDADIVRLRGDVPPVDAERSIQDLVTVIVTASPIPSHPGTAVIEETVESVRAQPGLGLCEVLIVSDGLREEQAHMAEAYEEYAARLLWLANHRWRNVLPIFLPEHVHQANATRAALAEVQTPLILFVEHDTPILGDIDWPALCRAVLSGDVNLVRLHHEASILEPHRHLMLDAVPISVEGAPLLRTAQWSQRPHLASALFYRWVIETHFGRAGRTMIEDAMHGVVDHAWRVGRALGWDRYRLAIYAPPGESIKRSTHLDGRAGGPKFEDSFTFEYDGAVPVGAPRPTSQRIQPPPEPEVEADVEPEAGPAPEVEGS